MLSRCVDPPAQAESTLDALFADGARVVAIATRATTGLGEPTAAEEHGLVLAGFLTFVDRPKADAAESIARLQSSASS